MSVAVGTPFEIVALRIVAGRLLHLQIVARTQVGAGKALVKGNSQTGALGRGDETILDVQGMADLRQVEIAALSDALDHQETGDHGGQMDIRGPFDGACG